VGVELGAAGGAVPRVLAAHVKRRLAIVVDGTVESAPVIITEIPAASSRSRWGRATPSSSAAKRSASRIG
jgi:hypothetical protein